MAEYDISKSTTTSLDGSYSDFNVDSKVLDFASDEGETIYTFNKASEYIGYYKSIPEL